MTASIPPCTPISTRALTTSILADFVARPLLLAPALALCLLACSGDAAPQRDAGSSSTEDAALRMPDADASGDLGSLPQICSGCADERLDSSSTTVRVHHVHLNGQAEDATFDYYERFYPAQRVQLNGRRAALWGAPILILFDEVAKAPPSTLEMGLDHFGWWSPDPTGWFDALPEGIEGDMRNGSTGTPVTIPPPAVPMELTFVYLQGPNAERVEVYNGPASELRHVHFLTPDVDATVAWYSELLEIAPASEAAQVTPLLSYNFLDVDGVELTFVGPPFPVPARFVPTDDRPLGHLAFSVENLDRMATRARELGIDFVSDAAMTDHGFRSFFIRGPEEVLLEFVEAGEVPAP